MCRSEKTEKKVKKTKNAALKSRFLTKKSKVKSGGLWSLTGYERQASDVKVRKRDFQFDRVGFNFFK